MLFCSKSGILIKNSKRRCANLNSRQLQYAIMLAQSRSFSQVAEKLGMTQPALSKQIINLESDLGVKLFDRNHVPMTLTPAGEYFIQKAQTLLYEEEQLLKAIRQFQSGEKGRLDIGVTPFRSLYMMPGIVRQVKQRYPGVRVVLHEANSVALRKNAAEGKYDFAVVNLPVDESVLDITELEPDRLVLAVPNTMADKLPEKNMDSIDFGDCAGLPFVVVGQNQEMRQLYEKLCAMSGIETNIAAEVVGITTAWAMTKAGVGATILPYQFFNRNSFDEELVLIPIRNNIFTRQPAIVTRRGRYISEYAQYAMDLLVHEHN